MSFNNCLPPTQNPARNYGYIKLTPLSLNFTKNTQQTLLFKILFWGSNNPIYIPTTSTQIINITAPLLKFKQYLIDSKVTCIQIVDSRNYKPIACAFLNWLPYLRSYDDQQIYVQPTNEQTTGNAPPTYYLPFFDDVIEVTLPLFHFSAQHKPKGNERLGQLLLKWQCKIWADEANSRPNSHSNISSNNNLYNIRVSGAGNRNSQNISMCNIDLGPQQNIVPNQHNNHNQYKTNSSIKSYIGGNPRLLTTDYPPARRSGLSQQSHYRENTKVLQRVREELQMDQKCQTQHRGKQGKLDIQLMRLRMQVNELIEIGKIQQKIMLEIVYFASVNKFITSKDVASIDVKCQKNKQIFHSRLFPQHSQEDKTFFMSSLVCEANATLTFICNLKKGRELSLKGTVALNCVGEQCDVNMLTNQSVIFGFIKIKVDRKTNTVKETKSGSEKPVIVKSKENPLQFISNLQREHSSINQALKKDNKIFKIQNPLNSSPPNKIPTYFLILFKYFSSKGSQLDLSLFDVILNHNNDIKFILVTQQQSLNKMANLQIYCKQQLIHQQIIMHKIEQIPCFPQNLTCSLIHQHRIQRFDILCQVYAGSLSQVNYLLQQLPNQPKQVTKPLQERVKTNQSVPNFDQLSKEDWRPIEPKTPFNQQDRKMKTEGAVGVEQRGRRMTEQKTSREGESIGEKYQIPEGQNIQSEHQIDGDQNIYLVDLLTRFLDTLTPTLLPSALEIEKTQFLKIFTAFQTSKSTILQPQLIDIIASIFQNQINPNMLNLLPLQQCYKAYSNFMAMYKQQKTNLIKSILEKESKAVQRIKANSELGTINESVIWGRALAKIKDSAIRQKLNKFYKISSFSSTDCQFLLQDLQSKQQICLRPLDIGNLGLLIKQWVQQFIKQSLQQSILNLKQKLVSCGEEEGVLNIKSLIQMFVDNVGLRLSLWESLMLVEEIKGSYACDMELQEGIISWQTVFNWIDSSFRKQNKMENGSSLSSSQASLDPEEMAMIKQINQHSYQLRDVNQSMDKISVGLVNNDSDIVDIANLLREKDGFGPLKNVGLSGRRMEESRQMMKKEEEIFKNNSEYSPKHYSKSEHKQQNNALKVKQKQDQSQEVPSDKQKLKSKQQTKKTFKQIYIQIRQIKLYDPQSKPKQVKTTIQLDTPQTKQQYFYYLTQQKAYSEANSKIVKLIIDKQDRRYHAASLNVVVTGDKQQIVMKGVLPVQDIVQWICKGEKQCKKTVVMYQNGGKIGGKLALKLIDSKPKALQEQQSHNELNIIGITLNSMVPTLKQCTLKVSSNQQNFQQLLPNTKTVVALSQPVYHSQLHITDLTNELSCSISLQQLYLKKYIHAQYPLINIKTANFISALTITLTYQQQPGQINSPSLAGQQNKQQLIVQQYQTVYLINQINSKGYKTSYNFSGKLSCCLQSYDQNRQVKQQVVLVTPQFNLKIKQEPRKQIIRQKIEGELIGKNKYVKFKLTENGHNFASSNSVCLSQLSHGLHSNYINLYGQQKILVCLNIVKLKIKSQKYSMRRIYECLHDLPTPITQKQLSSYTKTSKQKHNLTVTEQQILKQIIQDNSNNLNIASVLTAQDKYVINTTIQTGQISMILIDSLMNELMYLEIQFAKEVLGGIEKYQFLRVLHVYRQDQFDINSIKQLQKIIDSITNLGQINPTNIPYIWLFSYILGKQPKQPDEKKSVYKQIDGIYQSMRHKYG